MAIDGAIDVLRREIDRVIADAPMPGRAVAIANSKQVLLEVVAGKADLTSGEAVTAQHWWDLASLTKVLVTLPAVLDLVHEGLLDLCAPLSDQWRRSKGTMVGEATPAQLLSHAAGFPAEIHLYRHCPAQRSMLVEELLRVTRERPPGNPAVYSDIGFLLLGELVADLRNESLDVLAHRSGPFRFAPIPGAAVATEDCPWRGFLVKGRVHDENAYALGGVAGQAGAFGQLSDVAAASRRWLQAARSGDPDASLTTSEWSRGANGERFGLGWWLNPTGQLGGNRPGEGSFGMSGFVGNRLWLEPARDYCVAILSNRIHPHRGKREPFNAWCARLLDAVADVLA